MANFAGTCTSDNKGLLLLLLLLKKNICLTSYASELYTNEYHSVRCRVRLWVRISL